MAERCGKHGVWNCAATERDEAVALLRLARLAWDARHRLTPKEADEVLEWARAQGNTDPSEALHHAIDAHLEGTDEVDAKQEQAD